MKNGAVAVLTIKGPGNMTPKGRRQIAIWLQSVAAGLVTDGRLYTFGRFRARYYYK